MIKDLITMKKIELKEDSKKKKNYLKHHPSYALGNINLNQKSTNYLVVKDDKKSIIKKFEDNQNTEIWKYKDSIKKKFLKIQFIK